MPRLIDWPSGLQWTSREPLTGPRSVKSGSSESVTGWVQTFGSPFGLWRWSYSFSPLRGTAFRAYRGLVVALHGGPNAVRLPFCDPDGLSWKAMGVEPDGQLGAGIPWSNGMPWSNGRPWQIGRPTVAVAQAAANGDSIVYLADEWWGYGLGVGDMIGFAPFHFGVYFVTEVIEPGRYRIWPPLRRALATSDEATLTPVLAMRLESEGAANAGRGIVSADGLAMTLVEIEDADVRDYFTD